MTTHISLHRDDACKPRIWRSSGLVVMSPTDELAGQYCPNAAIPRTPWEAIKPDWAAMHSFQQGAGIAVLKIGMEYCHDLAMTMTMDGHFTENLQARRLFKRIQQVCHTDEAIFNGGVTRLPDRTTVTLEPESNKRIGLHIDSWDKDPIHRRRFSTNRICVNLGPEPRSFLFLDPSIDQMEQAVQGEASQPNPSSGTASVLAEFFRMYPNEPVYRVEICPGEAYIAPTENIVHDACTLGNKLPNMSVSWRGHIRPIASLGRKSST